MRSILLALAACAPAAAPPTLANPAPMRERVDVLPRTVIARGENAIAMAADGDRVWWLRDDGTLRRASQGTVVTVAKVSEYYAATLAVAGGSLFGASRDVWTIGGPLVAGVEASTLAVGRDAIYFDDGAAILAVPRTGGATTMLVRDAGTPIGLVLADGYLYWGDGGDDAIDPHHCRRVNGGACPPEPERRGAIERVALDGGKPAVIVADQRPIAIAVMRDRVWWVSKDGALRSAPVAGGATRTELPRGVVSLTADAHGVVAATEDGEVIEWVAEGGAPRVRAMLESDGGYDAPVLALDDRDVYLGESTGAIVRVPRGEAALTVAASTGGAIEAIAGDGDRIDYLADDQVWTVGDAGPRRLGAAPDAGALAADHGTIATADNRGDITVLGGATLHTDDEIGALAIDRGSLYWLADGDPAVLRRASLAGGAARDLVSIPLAEEACEPREDSDDCPPTVRVARDGDALVVGGGEAGQVIRLADGETTVLSGQSDGFAFAGDDRVAVWQNGRGLVLEPGDEVLSPDTDPDDHAAVLGEDALGVWLLREADRDSLVHVAFGRGTTDRVIDGVEARELASTGDAIWFTNEPSDLLLRLDP